MMTIQGRNSLYWENIIIYKIIMYLCILYNIIYIGNQETHYKHVRNAYNVKYLYL